MRKSFNVFGKKVPIKTFKETAENAHIMGYCSKYPLAIYLNENLPKEHLEETCLHEATHAIIFRLGLDQVLTPEVNEMICETFSKFIIENYKIKT